LSEQPKVNFAEVIKNAEVEGVDLSELVIFYEGLTLEELYELKRHNLIVNETDVCVIGRFTKEGFPLFPTKATGVYSLWA
jgi:hypothetical protein